MDTRPGQASGPPQTDADDAAKSKQPPLVFRVLRELRTEVSDLSVLIGQIKSGTTSVESNAGYIRKTVQDIKALIVEINELNKDRRSDTIRHVNNCWEQMQVSPVLTKPTEARPPQEQLHELSLLESQAREIVLAVGHMTIPHRLNRWLEKVRPGYYLPFHLLFEDELPLVEDRNRVLNAIAWAPDAVDSGIVDTRNGLIYRYESAPEQRLRSLFSVIALFVLATLLVMAAGRYAGVLGLDVAPGSSALRIVTIGWAAVLAGILVHVAVSRFKRDKDTGLPPVIAINDWLIHLSAHKGEIVGKLGFAIIGLFGLVFTVGLDGTTTTTAFLVGYSLDSFVGLFASSVEQKAAAQLNALRGQLGDKRAVL